MRHRRLHRSRSVGEINVTPLIDVVMCLIIFYLMVGKLAGDRRTQVELPETKVGTEADSSVLIVNVVPVSGAGWPGSGAQVVVERAVIPGPEDLERLVRDRIGSHPGLAVQVRAEKNLPWDLVKPVLRSCTRAGAATVRLAAERAGGAGRGTRGGGGQ
jgi:biopolymer transport protein ExbD